MTVQEDLAALFDISELTVPVQLGESTARGYYDETGTELKAGGIEVQIVGPVLFLVTGALPSLVVGSQVRIGGVGAASAAAAPLLRVHALSPVQDGLLVACHVGGGR